MEVKKLVLDGSDPSRAREQVNPAQSAVNTANRAPEVHNAILVNKELLSAALAELKAKLPTDHRMPGAREVIDWCVRETGDYVAGVYSTLVRKEVYKWFDSDVAKAVQLRDDILDKGRFVDACIIATVYGEAAVREFCRGIPVAILPTLSAEEKTRIKQSAAEIAAMKGKEVGVRPAPSFPRSENL